MQAELVGDLGCVHGVGQILLVGEDEQKGITELILVEHPLQLLACLRDTFPIVRVDDENDTLRVLEVCAGRISLGPLRGAVSHAQCLQRGRILS